MPPIAVRRPPRHRLRARAHRVGRVGPRHRDPVVGLRQHRDPLPGLPAGGRAAHRRSRRSTTRRRSTATPGSPARSPCTSRGTRSTTTPGSRPTRRERGLRIGGINSNTFQDDDYKLGLALPSRSAAVRAKAVGAIVECCEIAADLDAQAVKVWLGDGTNYPGQDDLRWRRHRLVEGLREVYAAPARRTSACYLEYKLYEPALYSTDVQDWGQSLVGLPRQLGDRAGVCVDTGHHAMGVNIEQIVALLLAEGRLGAFDLNDKKYGDDDLMVGSIDPYQLFRIAHELVNAMRDDGDPVRPALRERRRLHARPVPQHRAQGPGHDPLGHEPPGDDGQGAPRGPRGAARRPGGGRRPGGQPPARRTPSRPTSGRSSPSCAPRAACRPIRTGPTSPRGEAEARVGRPRRRHGGRLGLTPPTGRPAGPSDPQEASVAHQGTLPELDEILASIGEGGQRIATIDAGEGAAGNISVCIGWPIEVRRRFPVAEPIDAARAGPAPGRPAVIVTGSGRRLRDIAADPVANLGAVGDRRRTARRARSSPSPRRLFERLTSEWNSHLAVHDDTVARDRDELPRRRPRPAAAPDLPLPPPGLPRRGALQPPPAALGARDDRQPAGRASASCPSCSRARPTLMEANVESLRDAPDRALVASTASWPARDVSVTRAVDRIEYAETAARYEYMDLVNGGRAEGLTIEEMRAVVEAFDVKTTIV